MESVPRRTEVVPGAPAAFARFVLCGGGIGVASSFAVAALAACMPWVLANALITVASTLLATELHARFTFGSGRRGSRLQHVQSAGSATAAYGVTCVAMAVLHHLTAAPGALLEQSVYLSASALAGVGRFLVLRLVVFAGGGHQKIATPAAAPVRVQAQVPVQVPVRVQVPVPVPVQVAGQSPSAARTGRTAPGAAAPGVGPAGFCVLRFRSVGVGFGGFGRANAAPALRAAA